MKVLLIAAFLSSVLAPSAFAGDGVWDDAFPVSQETYRKGQLGIGLAESAVGGVGMLASKLAGDGSSDTADQYLDRKFREVAREEVIAANPNYKKSLEAQEKLEGEIKENHRWGTGHRYEEKLRMKALREEIDSLSVDFAKGDAMLKSKVDSYYAGMQPGKKVPSAVEGIVEKFRKSTKESRLMALGSAAMLIDGGFRLIDLVNHRDAGFRPSVNTQHSSIKSAPAANPSSEVAGAQTSMAAD
jgi:hypothetical protein